MALYLRCKRYPIIVSQFYNISRCVAYGKRLPQDTWEIDEAKLAIDRFENGMKKWEIPEKVFSNEELLYLKEQGFANEEISKIHNKFEDTPVKTSVERHIRLGELVKEIKDRECDLSNIY